ncbi:MAG: sulfite exporter TauE/SafE family protein, partial [Nocardioides sp.]
LLVVFGGPLSRAVARRHEADGGLPDAGLWWVWPAVFVCGIYGGYFGAAQGVLLMAVMGLGISETLQRLNGVKNVLASAANGVAALVFVAVAEVDWRLAGLIAVSSVAGAQVGARYGRRLPDRALRAVIVVVGITALIAFLR